MPASYILHLEAAVRACGGNPEPLLAQIGRPLSELSDPAARIPFSAFVRLHELALGLIDEPGLGFVLGAAAPITRFGSLGFAAMAQATLGDAIETIERYMPIITTACHYRSYREHGRAVIELEECANFGAARETFMFALTTALWRLGEMLTGRPLPGDVEFPFPEPPYFARFAVGAPGTCTFNASGNRMRLDADYLALPLLTADPATARSAREHCERELLLLQPDASVVQRVREILREGIGDNPTPQQVARKLGMAERTLKRRLAEHGTSYSAVLALHLKQRALELLHTPASIEDIATRLGYSDSANFTRAFRRWTGSSPRAFRRPVRASAAERDIGR